MDVESSPSFVRVSEREALALECPPMQVGDGAHFGAGHPVARVAALLCQGRGHGRRLPGGVACGSCWERAVRRDERVLIEEELPREAPVDPSYVDEIAVEMACRGDHPPLTELEYRRAWVRLRAGGIAGNEVAEMLRGCRRQAMVSPLIVRRAS